MSKKDIIVRVILLTGGSIALFIAIFFTVVFILVEFNPPDNGHVRWIEVALYLIPLALIGVGLTWLGVNYTGRNKG